MIYKLVSIGTILDKVTRDLHLNDEDLPVDDFIEWSGEALKLIGGYSQYIDKEANITIKNYKGELPCDFMFPIDWFDSSKNRLRVNNSLIGSTTREIQNNTFTQHDIKLSPTGVITTSFEHGTIVLQYQAFPIDEDGLPLIPDLVEFANALFWKIVYQLRLRGHEFKIKELNDFQFVERQWNKHCIRARAESAMPDGDQLEKFKNNWLRLKPDMNQYRKRFYSNGRQEDLKLNGKNSFPNSYNY